MRSKGRPMRGARGFEAGFGPRLGPLAGACAWRGVWRSLGFAHAAARPLDWRRAPLSCAAKQARKASMIFRSDVCRGRGCRPCPRHCNWAAAAIVRADFGRGVRAAAPSKEACSMLITPAYAQAAGGGWPLQHAGVAAAVRPDLRDHVLPDPAAAAEAREAATRRW